MSSNGRKSNQMKLFQFAHFRLVYKWFYFIYKLSYALGIIGYIIMMLTFVGFNLIFGQPPNVWMDIGFMFIYYGVYFGVLGRDISEIIADKMAANIGVSRIYLLHVSFRKISIFNISKRKISSSFWIFRRNCSRSCSFINFEPFFSPAELYSRKLRFFITSNRLIRHLP